MSMAFENIYSKYNESLHNPKKKRERPLTGWAYYV